MWQRLHAPVFLRRCRGRASRISSVQPWAWVMRSQCLRAARPSGQCGSTPRRLAADDRAPGRATRRCRPAQRARVAALQPSSTGTPRLMRSSVEPLRAQRDDRLSGTCPARGGAGRRAAGCSSTRASRMPVWPRPVATAATGASQVPQVRSWRHSHAAAPGRATACNDQVKSWRPSVARVKRRASLAVCWRVPCQPLPPASSARAGCYPSGTHDRARAVKSEARRCAFAQRAQSAAWQRPAPGKPPSQRSSSSIAARTREALLPSLRSRRCAEARTRSSLFHVLP